MEDVYDWRKIFKCSTHKQKKKKKKKKKKKERDRDFI